mmetsp:Transcript_23908/g.56326  ORF Transcript_23908/g.56326 Transcript_23908/m.56326 type:complete len:210 (+) Transcript_23908:1658-2287(+)
MGEAVLPLVVGGVVGKPAKGFHAGKKTLVDNVGVAVGRVVVAPTAGIVVGQLQQRLKGFGNSGMEETAMGSHDAVRRKGSSVCCERTMLLGVVISCRNHRGSGLVEFLNQVANPFDRGVPLVDPKGTARQKVVLHVDDDQRVGGRNGFLGLFAAAAAAAAVPGDRGGIERTESVAGIGSGCCFGQESVVFVEEFGAAAHCSVLFGSVHL